MNSGPSGESGHHLKPWAMQSQHFISGTWLVKFNMGELALGSVQTGLSKRTCQGRRDDAAEKEKLAKKGQYGLTQIWSFGLQQSHGRMEWRKHLRENV